MSEEGMGFLLAPVARHFCKYESLKDGTLDLMDIIRLNELIDVLDENTRRMNEKP